MVMLLVIATVIMLVVITNYNPQAKETPVEEMLASVEVGEESSELIQFEKLGFTLKRCYKGVTYCRYEFIPDSFHDIKERVKELHNIIKEDKYVQIFILNPNNEEQVIYLFEEGVVTWTFNGNALAGK